MKFFFLFKLLSMSTYLNYSGKCMFHFSTTDRLMGDCRNEREFEIVLI